MLLIAAKVTVNFAVIAIESSIIIKKKKHPILVKYNSYIINYLENTTMASFLVKAQIL